MTDLASFLHILGLDEYALFFKEKRIYLNEFVKLSESDLKTIGVRYASLPSKLMTFYNKDYCIKLSRYHFRKLGPRRKMALAAQKYNYLKELSKQLQNSTYY